MRTFNKFMCFVFFLAGCGGEPFISWNGGLPIEDAGDASEPDQATEQAPGETVLPEAGDVGDAADASSDDAASEDTATGEVADAGGDDAAADGCDAFESGTVTVTALDVRRFVLEPAGPKTWDAVRLNSSSGVDIARSVVSWGYYDGNSNHSFRLDRLMLRFPALTGVPSGATVQDGWVTVRAVSAAKAYVPWKYDIHLVSFAPANPVSPVSSDFSISKWGSVSFGSDPLQSFVPGLLHDLKLNATGLGALSLTSENILGLRTHFDLQDIAPPDSDPQKTNGLTLSSPPPEEVKLTVKWTKKC